MRGEYLGGFLDIFHCLPTYLIRVMAIFYDQVSFYVLIAVLDYRIGLNLSIIFVGVGLVWVFLYDGGSF